MLLMMVEMQMMLVMMHMMLLMQMMFLMMALMMGEMQVLPLPLSSGGHELLSQLLEYNPDRSASHLFDNKNCCHISNVPFYP